MKVGRIKKGRESLLIERLYSNSRDACNAGRQKIILLDRSQTSLVKEGEIWSYSIKFEKDRFCVGQIEENMENWPKTSFGEEVKRLLIEQQDIIREYIGIERKEKEMRQRKAPRPETSSYEGVYVPKYYEEGFFELVILDGEEFVEMSNRCRNKTEVWASVKVKQSGNQVPAPDNAWGKAWLDYWEGERELLDFQNGPKGDRRRELLRTIYTIYAKCIDSEGIGFWLNKEGLRADKLEKGETLMSIMEILIL